MPLHTPVMSNQWPFEPIVCDVIAQLARGEYEALERRSAGVRLSAAEIAAAVAEYGRRIIPHPSGALTLDVVEIRGAEPAAWSVDVPLWTVEEGHSDLTLQLTLRAEPSAGYRVEIDDLHVL